MTETDYILLMTSCVLRASGDQLKPILEVLKKPYNLDTPFQPGTVGIGGRQKDDYLSYTQWIQWLRSLSIERIDYTYLPGGKAGLPAHQLAAFAGNIDYIMSVTTKEAVLSFVLLTRSSPSYLLDPASFVALVNAQPMHGKRWLRIGQVINESNSLNNQPEIDPAVLPDHLQTQEGKAIYDYMASRLIEEMQIDAVLDEQPFIIPESLQPAFYRPGSMFALPAKDFIALYNLRTVTAAELLELLEAQPGKKLIGQAIAKELADLLPASFSLEAPDGWSSLWRSLSPEDLQTHVYAVCGCIADHCTEQHIFPVIQDSLATAFGPDALEQRRGIIRGRSSDRWQLAYPPKPWRFQYFEPIESSFYPQPPSSDPEQQFLKALHAIEEFARKTDSVFAGAFQLAGFVLGASFNPASGSEQEAARWKEVLQQQGFSANAMQVFERHFYLADLLQSGLDLQRVKGVMAIDHSNVFGGMGSWNDQYFENDQEEYQRISADFFEAMKRYFGTLLSG